MPFGAAYVLGEVFVPLIIVLPIVAARRRADGPLIACAALAIVCYVALLLLSGPQGGLLIFGPRQDSVAGLRFLLYGIAGATAQAAWVLAVYQAALARHARWIGALAAAQVLANAALLLGSNPCFLVEISGNFSPDECIRLAPQILYAISAAWLIGPAAALAFALRARLPRRRTPHADPDVLSIGDMPNAEGELELHTERL